jgi:hypothetical protein
MIRTLGVLVGSGLAVAALIVFVGIPAVHTDSHETPIGDNGIIRLPAAPALEPTPPAQPDTAPDLALATTDEVFDDVIEEPAAEAVEGAVESPADDAFVDTVSRADRTQNWYAFWAPFRTEIAANGFVTQLQRVTGLDYRVVKVETGSYEVAFAYSDDDEILSHLSQISAATGLQLPEG